MLTWILVTLQKVPRLTRAAQFWKKGPKEGEGVANDDGHVPDEWLEADIKQGISAHDVETRRKRFGWNELVSEKENMFLKFLGFFRGPILYGKHSLSFTHTHSCQCLAMSPSSRPVARLFAFAAAELHTSSGRKMLGTPSRICALLHATDTLERYTANAWQSWNSLSSSPPVSVTGSIWV